MLIHVVPIYTCGKVSRQQQHYKISFIYSSWNGIYIASIWDELRMLQIYRRNCYGKKRLSFSSLSIFRKTGGDAQRDITWIYWLTFFHIHHHRSRLRRVDPFFTLSHARHFNVIIIIIVIIFLSTKKKRNSKRKAHTSFLCCNL